MFRCRGPHEPTDRSGQLLLNEGAAKGSLVWPQFKSTIEDLGEGGESISSLVLSDTEDVHLLTSPPAADGSDDNISDLTIGICSHTLQTLPKMLEVSLLNLFLALLLDSDLGALTRTSGRSSPM